MQNKKKALILFPLLVSNQVFIITLIGDIKFQHFNPVLETYINKHFSATLAYMWVSALRFSPLIASHCKLPADLHVWLIHFLRKLTRVLNYYVGHAEEPVLTERLYTALKALKYLFRFIVQSRVLYLRYAATQLPVPHSQVLSMSSFDAVLALFFRFYGNSEDGDAFFNSIRTLFLSFNTLMDRPLDEGVKIKVSLFPVAVFWLACFMLYN